MRETRQTRIENHTYLDAPVFASHFTVPAPGYFESAREAYWTAHKDVYETVVLSPRKAIPAELAPEFGDGKVFRPNRDVRFSTGKSQTRRTSDLSSVPAIGTAG